MQKKALWNQTIVLVDSNTGTVLKLPNQGKKTYFAVTKETYGVGGAVVITFLQRGYLEKFHKIVADNKKNGI